MKKTYCALMLLSTSILFSCQPDAPQNQESLSNASSTNTARILEDQAYLAQLVKDAEIADNERSLVHVSHTCKLTIDGQTYAAVDMRELIKGATTARGVNQVLLLNAENQLISRVEYGNARPLFCEDNKLYLHGDVIPEGQAEEGNVLVFTDSGFSVSAIKEDLNTKLPIH